MMPTLFLKRCDSRPCESKRTSKNLTFESEMDKDKKLNFVNSMGKYDVIS